jgi:hypothetical protein
MKSVSSQQLRAAKDLLHRLNKSLLKLEGLVLPTPFFLDTLYFSGTFPHLIEMS